MNVTLALDGGGHVIGVYANHAAAVHDLEGDLEPDEPGEVQYQEWPVKGENHVTTA